MPYAVVTAHQGCSTEMVQSNRWTKKASQSFPKFCNEKHQTKQHHGTKWSSSRWSQIPGLLADGPSPSWTDFRFCRFIPSSFEALKVNFRFRIITKSSLSKTRLLYLRVLRGFAKLNKFQKAKIKLDRAHTTHPPGIQTFFGILITDMDRILKS